MKLNINKENIDMEKRKNVHLKPNEDVLSDLSFQVGHWHVQKNWQELYYYKKVIQKSVNQRKLKFASYR